MDECKYLYFFNYACKHYGPEKFDHQLSRNEFYRLERGKCPACREKCEATAAEREAELEKMRECLLPENREPWEDRRSPCPKCGKLLALVDTPEGPMCRTCRKKRGYMDGKQGICDVCHKKLILHFTGVEGRLMVCRHCWENVTGKPAQPEWARPGRKDGKGRKARVAE